MIEKHPVLSLFSCCGGLDLGLEGNFTVFDRQIDKNNHPDWIEDILYDGRLLLSENSFTTVFANDIDKNAKNAWTRFFQTKKHRNNAGYVLESVVDLVKQSQQGEYEFPKADVVTGGFPCLEEGTPVLTEHGYAPIEKLSKNMLVYSHDGKLHKVTYVLDQGYKESYKIQGGNYFQDVVATGNHKFYCRSKIDSSTQWLDVSFLIENNQTGAPNYLSYMFGRPEKCSDAMGKEICDLRDEKGYIWFNIENIVPCGETHVYDITVEDTHSFIAAGHVTHNCCDFSVSGKRQGFNSTKSDTEENLDAPSPESRGMLYYWMREVIGIVKPKMFIAENVKGLASLGDVQQVIEKDFSTCGNGYVVVPARVLHSADYGVAQNRERIIFFGFDKTQLTKDALKALSSENIPEEFDPYPKPTHNYTDQDNNQLMPFFTAAEALSGLGEPEDSTDPSHKAYSKAKFMGKHCQGQTEVKLDGIGPTIRSKHHGNIEYRRLSKEHGGVHNEELAKGLSERRLSVRECARIQSFPDEYEFVFPKEKDTDGKVIADGISGSAAYVLVGNAVPPLLGYHIARRIMECWDIWFE